MEIMHHQIEHSSLDCLCKGFIMRRTIGLFSSPTSSAINLEMEEIFDKSIANGNCSSLQQSNIQKLSIMILIMKTDLISEFRLDCVRGWKKG